jgi:hypothetical protein
MLLILITLQKFHATMEKPPAAAEAGYAKAGQANCKKMFFYKATGTSSANPYHMHQLILLPISLLPLRPANRDRQLQPHAAPRYLRTL